MIKLKDILKELDYGEKLWADPSRLDDSKYEKFLQYLYGNDYTEEDTYWEEEMFWKIKNYIEDEIMYVGNEIFADKIYLTNYDSIFRVLKNLYDKAYKKSL